MLSLKDSSLIVILVKFKALGPKTPCIPSAGVPAHGREHVFEPLSVMPGSEDRGAGSSQLSQPTFASIFPLNLLPRAPLLLIITCYCNLRDFMCVKEFIPFADVSTIF